MQLYGEANMAKKRVVLTGACGYVAQRMFDDLAERYDLVPMDNRTTTKDGREIPGIVACDLTDPHRDSYCRYFANADAVIHCAFVSAPGGDATTWRDTGDAKFQAEQRNIAMAYNIYRTCLEQGVRRVVVASSNHAADYYERLIWADRFDLVTPELMPLSDNFYGWAKAAYELLGFVFATGKVGGRKLEVIQWRIGAPRDDDIDQVKPGDMKGMHRALGHILVSATRYSRWPGWSRPRILKMKTVSRIWWFMVSAETRTVSGASRTRVRSSVIDRGTTVRSSLPTRLRRCCECAEGRK